MDIDKIFSTQKSSNRGIADEPAEETPKQAEPSVLEILDALGYFVDRRFSELEAKLDGQCACRKK
jgi:hypothetical protein